MNRIRVGVVGLNFGSWMIEHELLVGEGAACIEIVAVCDLQTDKVAFWSARLAVPGYTNLHDILQQSNIQAIALFTGPVGRSLLIQQIIDSGRDVITTKPFDGDMNAAQTVLHAAIAARRVVHLNSPPPQMTPDIAQLHTWMTKYDLGRPIAYRATTWCSYREVPDGSWYDDPQRCPVAPIFRLGIYLINDLSWFFTHVQDVSVMQSRVFTQRPTADNAQLSVQYTNGAIGSVFASFCIADQQYYRCALEMNFANGTLYRNVGPFTLGSEVQLSLVTVQGGDQRIINAQTPPQGAGYQWRAFQRAVWQSEGMTEAYAERILTGLQVINAMQRAISPESGVCQ
jgi:predicted dehydrogenase